MKYFFFFFLLFFLPSSLHAHPDFFIMGSGKIALRNIHTGSSVKTDYRHGENEYDEKNLKKINALYGGPISLRFLELLAYLQDHFNGALIQILSGYRSPHENEGLRKKGRLAALSSMHKEAAAADLKLAGVDPTKVRDFLMALHCCGVGYYHGKHVHVDTGPSRWWDEKTSGTEKTEPQENEKIILLTQKDIYLPHEKIVFDFARVSDYPIGISPPIELEKWGRDEWKKIFSPLVKGGPGGISNTSCQVFDTRKQVKNLSIDLPQSLAPSRYRMTVTFCNKRWEKMPEKITSNEFEIRE